MSANLSTCFFSHGCCSLSNSSYENNKVDYSYKMNLNMRLLFLSSPRFLPAFCKPRQRNLSANHKRQRGKEPPSERIPIRAELQSIGDGETEPENSVINGVEMEHFVNHETNCKDEDDSVTDVEHIDGYNLGILQAVI
ncbi:hypothetical protein HRI_002982500 [Hibiscus trionum]|uniref:Uncharacterized protein n=1 Tax=Hibiscus trionum TaxID=183268 RepID=A0A9W7IBL0_HIBTR|nr:hypothetical protein HRI_002982500 [Hibiscus trionum]